MNDVNRVPLLAGNNIKVILTISILWYLRRHLRRTCLYHVLWNLSHSLNLSLYVYMCFYINASMLQSFFRENVFKNVKKNIYLNITKYLYFLINNLLSHISM